MSRAPSSADAIAARLARGSRVVAEEFKRRWPVAVAAFGLDEAAAWGDLGASLLESVANGSGAALAYFRSVSLAAPSAERAAWVAAAGRVAAVSPALAASFCEVTAPLVGEVPGDHLAAFAREAARLRTQSGWRGERLAHLFVAAAPVGLRRLEPEHFTAWCRVAVGLAAVVPESQVLRELPLAVQRWSTAERSDWLAWAEALIVRRPSAAWGVYREAPPALAGLRSEHRACVLAACRAAGPVADALVQESLVPVLGAVVTALPAAERATALGLVGEVAAAFPAGVPDLLKILGRVYEEGPPGSVSAWVAAGIGLGARQPAAALAFFAFASRTSQRVLHASPTSVTLEDVQAVARRFIHMLTGRAIALRGEGGLRLGLPLGEGADDGALPAQIDCGPTAEDNQRVYRALSAVLAARRLYGTYDGTAVLEAVRADERALLAPCFRLADGYRVACRLAGRYEGLATELRWLGQHCLERWSTATVTDAPFVCDGLLGVLLAGDAPAVPPWLAPAAAAALPLLRPLASPTTTVADALAVAELLVAVVPFPVTGTTAEAELSEYARFMLELGGGEDAFPPPASGSADGPGAPAAADADQPLPADARDLQFEIDEILDELVNRGRPLTAAELQRVLDSGVLPKLSQVEGLTPQQAGLYVTQLVGKLLAAAPRTAPTEPRALAAARPRPRAGVDQGAVHRYDEWDYEIDDYRPAWCHLREVPIADDAGVFFTQTLERHAALVPEIRRHFQRVLPETYRPVRGLEDGEEFDLNAVIDARVQRRAGHGAPSKLYRARVRQDREVATLFLLDMSASTDESPPSGEGRRIIDLAKDALVLMAAALDEIGDACAIYGFSGQGHEQVEIYTVKRFDERLSAAVKGRIGGIEPKGSTRMGTALRHVSTKLRAVSAPSRHVILLSDGFPQDLDYGRDRHSHTYGIRDTAKALRELEADGIKPFCITVDLAGHDYLRTMCDPQRYLVIERLVDLPRELPKIYQRLVRAA